VNLVDGDVDVQVVGVVVNGTDALMLAIPSPAQIAFLDRRKVSASGCSPARKLTIR
jgi:hypothetical protein